MLRRQVIRITGIMRMTSRLQGKDRTFFLGSRGSLGHFQFGQCIIQAGLLQCLFFSFLLSTNCAMHQHTRYMRMTSRLQGKDRTFFLGSRGSLGHFQFGQCIIQAGLLQCLFFSFLLSTNCAMHQHTRYIAD